MKTQQIYESVKPAVGSTHLTSKQLSNLLLCREDSNPVVSTLQAISTPKATVLKISPSKKYQKHHNLGVKERNAVEEINNAEWKNNFEYECESTHAQYSSDLENDVAGVDQESDCAVSFLGHDSIESFEENEQDSLFADDDAEEIN